LAQSLRLDRRWALTLVPRFSVRLAQASMATMHGRLRTQQLYVRFPFSLRLVEEMLLERGIVVSHESGRLTTCRRTSAI
jgi:hypothetical protein